MADENKNVEYLVLDKNDSNKWKIHKAELALRDASNTYLNILTKQNSDSVEILRRIGMERIDRNIDGKVIIEYTLKEILSKDRIYGCHNSAMGSYNCLTLDQVESYLTDELEDGQTPTNLIFGEAISVKIRGKLKGDKQDRKSVV